MTPRGQQRFMQRWRKAVEYRMKALEGGGRREKDRRIRQMLNGQLTESNGLVKEYDPEPGPIGMHSDELLGEV